MYHEYEIDNEIFFSTNNPFFSSTSLLFLNFTDIQLKKHDAFHFVYEREVTIMLTWTNHDRLENSC